MRLIIATLAFIGLTTPLYASPIDDLNFYTEQYPPYNMKVGGEKQGISIEILREVLDAADTKKGISDVEVVPWARGYKTALNKPDTVLFSTTRTAAREDKFIWVGPIVATEIGIIGGADAPAVSAATDLGDDRTATIRDDVAEQLLVQADVPMSALQRNSRITPIVRQLETGRVDYWAYETNVARHVLKQQDANKDGRLRKLPLAPVLEA
jgi:ABC-type amino acid transport substrate-binding protein